MLLSECHWELSTGPVPSHASIPIGPFISPLDAYRKSNYMRSVRTTGGPTLSNPLFRGINALRILGNFVIRLCSEGCIELYSVCLRN